MDYLTLQAAFTETLKTLVQSAAALIPKLLISILLIGSGWLVARVTRASISKLVGLGLSRLGRVPGIGQSLEKTALRNTIAWFTSALAYWTIFLFFGATAIENLELAVASDLVSKLAYYLPRVLSGMLLIFAGLLAGDAANTAVTKTAESAGISHGALLGRGIQILFAVIGFVIGADQLGIKSTMLTIIVPTLLAVMFGGATLAFSLGSRPAVTNILASHYIRKLYEVGQRVRVGDIEGRIVEFSQTGVLLDSAEGRVHIPAGKFNDTASILLLEGD